MWMKSDLHPNEAAHILNSLAVPTEAFTWYIDKAIGNVRNQDRRLAAPLPA